MNTNTWGTINNGARVLGKKFRAGVTLMEIMVVIIIIAIISAGVGAAVYPRLQKAKEESTKADAQAIRSAAEQFRMENNGTECPTVDKLVEDHYLDKSKRKMDAWDQPFTVTCEEDDITVVSSGKDKQPGTEDDITTARQ